MAMIRRFVNIVAENYKRGVYSLHRIDVSKHLFYPSTDQAQADTGGGEDKQMVETLQELPAPSICMQGVPVLNAKVPFFGLFSPRSSESRILCIDEAGQSVLYDAGEQLVSLMPDLEEFEGPVNVSVSIAHSGAKEESMYIMHGGPDGLDMKSCFSVLRFGTSGRRWTIDGCYWNWHSLPLPPSVYSLQHKPELISSYAVVEDGCTSTICLSSAAGGSGTYCFDTVKCEWWQAGGWMLPFNGRAEYVPDLNLLLGFSHQRPHVLCAMAVPELSTMAMDQPPKLQILWQNHTPEEWMSVRVNLLNLGSGKFAIAKVFRAEHNTGESQHFPDRDMVVDEFVVLTGVEICGDNNLQGLCTFEHKSIRYMCANSRIHQVL